MGYYLGLAGLRPQQRRFYLLMALGVPVLLHALFDFGVMTRVPGADVTPEDELPPWPSLVLMALSFTAWLAELGWAVFLIRRRRIFLMDPSVVEA